MTPDTAANAHPGQTDAGLAHGHPGKEEPSPEPGGDEKRNQHGPTPAVGDSTEPSPANTDVETDSHDPGAAVEITPDERGEADRD